MRTSINFHVAAPHPDNDAQFDANLPPGAVGRGHRQIQVTTGRKEHDKIQKKNAEAGERRAATRARNVANNNSGATPEAQNANHRRAASDQSAAPTETPRRLPGPPVMPNSGRSNPQKTSSTLPQTLRIPLQPVSANSSLAYPDFSRMDRSPSLMSTPPATQLNRGMEWLTSLPESTRAALFASLEPSQMVTSAGWNAGSSAHDRDQSQESTNFNLESFEQENYHEEGSDGLDSPNSWAQHPDDGPRDLEETPAVSSLETTIRSIQPAYHQKRKRRTVQESNPSDNEDEVSDEEEPAKPQPKKSRSIAVLETEHQEICAVSFDLIKIELTHRKPFPVAVGRGRAARARAKTDEFTELILTVFTDAAFDSGLEHVKPTAEDIALIRSRVPQFRSGIKGLARDLVPGAYTLVDISNLPTPTPELIARTVAENRARVEKILGTFIYTDPDNITQETMFLNAIFQKILNKYFFGADENNRAFYFQGMTRLELVTLALIVTAVECAIEEWTTGRHITREFSHKAYFKVYQANLAGLRKWMVHSEKQVLENSAASNMAIEALEQMLRVARATSYKPEEDPEQEAPRDRFSLDAMFSLPSGAA
ncbi:hypothetical protein B0H19DRAFT_8778 [Mycena capillaripes]|nr:hypothetical protein B0H19DRAFT_8778 [Mycena capillaripes]